MLCTQASMAARVSLPEMLAQGLHGDTFFEKARIL